MSLNDGICSQEVRILTHVVYFRTASPIRHLLKGLKKKAHLQRLKNGAKALLTFSAEKTRLAEDLNATIFDY